MCIIETCQVILLPQYFSKKKELANSFRVSGNPLGGGIFPFILVPIYENFGLRLSFIILASIFAQLGAFIGLLRPYKTHQLMVLTKRTQHLKGKFKVDTETAESSPAEKVKKFDLRLFQNPLYWTHVAMIVGYSLALPHAQYFVAVYCKSVHMSDDKISILLAYQAILDSITRLSIGFLLNKRYVRKTRCFSFW